MEFAFVCLLASSCFLGTLLAANIPRSHQIEDDELNQDIRNSLLPSSSTNVDQQRGPAFGGLAKLAKVFLEMEPIQTRAVENQHDKQKIQRENVKESLFGAAKSMFIPQQLKRTPVLQEGYVCPQAEDGQVRFLCPTSRNRDQCVDDHQICNGRWECPGREDEDPVMCLFYGVVRTHVGVLMRTLNTRGLHL